MEKESKAALETQAAADLEMRLRHGYLSLRELAALKKCGRNKLYEDIASGRLETEVHGGSRRIRGPVAAAYIPQGKLPKTDANDPKSRPHNRHGRPRKKAVVETATA